MISDPIIRLRAREAYNARGNPSLAAEVLTESGILAEAFAPSGISVSSHEAVELLDGGSRLRGKGVSKAVANVEGEIAEALVGRDVRNQNELDALLVELDGTPQKSRLGGNALTAVSLALAKAGAIASGLEVWRYLGGVQARSVPVPCINMISGSKTAGNSLDFEDHLVVPHGFDTACEALSACVEVFHVLHKALERQYGLIAQVTALAPPLETTDLALDALTQAIEKAGYAGRIGIGIDVAADNFYDEKSGLYLTYGRPRDTSAMIDWYQSLCGKYPIFFLEDPLQENDYAGFAEATRSLPCLVVGDDLFASNPDRLLQGRAAGAGNAMLLKVNQAGTVSEAMHVANMARDEGYALIASLRSGETQDDVQADIACAAGAALMKLGAPCRGESTAKYNRLLWIEREQGHSSRFMGVAVAATSRRGRGGAG
jgi:enolase